MPKKTLKKKKKLNVKLLRQVRDVIRKYPDQFMMDNYFDDYNMSGGPVGRCGTAACIAGWCITLKIDSKKKSPKKAHAIVHEQFYNLFSDPINNCGRTECPEFYEAQKLLNITGNQARNLFFESRWPIEFRARHTYKTTPTEFAEIAAQRIDHFIEHGK
jgi:hypothetical protein